MPVLDGIDVYDPDDVDLRDSPQLEPKIYNLVPSPSPPPAGPLPLSATPSPEPEEGRKVSSPSNPRPSLGDAVLLNFMADGKHIDIARDAGEKPLALEIEEEESLKGGTAQKSGLDSNAAIKAMQIASNALREAARHSPGKAQKVALPKSPKVKAEPMEGVKATAVPAITTLYVDGRSAASHISQEGKHDTVAPLLVAAGERPPNSPKSSLTNENGPITLPSISDLLEDINHLTEAPAPSKSLFSPVPPGRPPPRFSAVPSHNHPYPYPNNNRGQSQTNGEPPQYQNPNENSGSNTETPTSDQSGSTPGLSATDCGSGVGITNPRIGGFQCTHQGCTAAFQTRYLLQSHANVHSQNRPHYCSVKGCPRSEGGKGFKRKNEMIRHGLVHGSPGYVCPFCPDREHKYPRPDNLQRHVRVHHMDKDKDDAQLRDVLSQHPEEPSRSRRRRGGTS